MEDQKKQWVAELEAAIEERHRTLVAPKVRPRLVGLLSRPMRVTETDVFPISAETGMKWADPWDMHMSTILLKGHEVPDWLYGYISHQNNTCLPENGTADECKEAILAVMEESAAVVVRRVGRCLAGYEISILTVEVDLMGEHISIHTMTKKPVMEVNTIMGNKVVRKAMPPRARVFVNTHVEQCRRTDDYLKNKPDRQEISREFFYEDGTIVRAEPDHWSAGSHYEPGDIIRIGSIAHRVEDERNPWQDIAHDGDPVAGRDDLRRIQIGTPFEPGERAYWNAARNR